MWILVTSIWCSEDLIEDLSPSKGGFWITSLHSWNRSDYCLIYCFNWICRVLGLLMWRSLVKLFHYHLLFYFYFCLYFWNLGFLFWGSAFVLGTKCHRIKSCHPYLLLLLFYGKLGGSNLNRLKFDFETSFVCHCFRDDFRWNKGLRCKLHQWLCNWSRFNDDMFFFSQLMMILAAFNCYSYYYLVIAFSLFLGFFLLLMEMA